MVEAARRESLVISNGMGVGITTYDHARAVALAAKDLELPVLSVVSGTGLPNLLVERLHRGNEEVLEALYAFNPDITAEILHDYLPNGPKPDERHKIPPKPQVLWSGSEGIKSRYNNLAVAAGFCEAYLAKRDSKGKPHGQPIGINVLEKVQLVHLPILLGAMIADVDYVFVGAGVPNQIPKVLDSFARGETARYRLYVEGTKDDYFLSLDPRPYLKEGQELRRPKFYAIVSFDTLATYLETKVGGVDGYVVEGCFGTDPIEPQAGGHNANPRLVLVDGQKIESYWDDGQPKYGPKDVPNLGKIIGLGKPVYLAGGQDDKLPEALALGAAGIGVGTDFALDDESGMRRDLKQQARVAAADGSLVVKTTCWSPTGFAFQVAQMEGTLSDPDVFGARERVCSIGHLVQIVANQKGELLFNCPAMPEEEYRSNGGTIADISGFRCLCPALTATAGFPNLMKNGEPEPPIVTLGKKLDTVEELTNLRPDHSYTAREVLVTVFPAGRK